MTGQRVSPESFAEMARTAFEAPELLALVARSQLLLTAALDAVGLVPEPWSPATFNYPSVGVFLDTTLVMRDPLNGLVLEANLRLLLEKTDMRTELTLTLEGMHAGEPVDGGFLIVLFDHWANQAELGRTLDGVIASAAECSGQIGERTFAAMAATLSTALMP